MTTVRLREIAPRLARARDGLLVERESRAAEIRKLRHLIERAERCEIHRELQFIRAGATRSSRYVDQRARKLEAIRRDLGYYRRRLAELEVAA